MSRTIIIGNGIAGYTVASTLSKAGAQVTQYSEEPYPFYSRIKLPQALGNKQALLTLPASAAPPFLAMGKVVRVDAERRTVILDDGTEDSYDALVLATGSRGRFPAPSSKESRTSRSSAPFRMPPTSPNICRNPSACWAEVSLTGGYVEPGIQKNSLCSVEISDGETVISKLCTFLSYQFNVQTYQQTGENGITQTLTGVTNNSLVFALVG
jgi:hypothetical protein